VVELERDGLGSEPPSAALVGASPTGKG